MLVFKDAFTDDELCSDSFPMKLVDGLIWEFKGKQVVRKEGDIVLARANPSAEGEDVDEGTEEHVERGIDFVLNHRLQEMNCYENVATFKSYIKSFTKKVVDLMAKNGKSEEEINEFKKKIQAWVVSLLSKDRFKQLQFFIASTLLFAWHIGISMLGCWVSSSGYWGSWVSVVGKVQLHIPFNTFTRKGEKMAEGHGDRQVAIVEYRDEPEGEVPYLMLVKEALVEEKQ